MADAPKLVTPPTASQKEAASQRDQTGAEDEAGRLIGDGQGQTARAFCW